MRDGLQQTMGGPSPEAAAPHDRGGRSGSESRRLLQFPVSSNCRLPCAHSAVTTARRPILTIGAPHLHPAEFASGEVTIRSHPLDMALPYLSA